MQVFDFLIIGSGFGGSVSAMRLAQKGYSVAIIEKGKRYNNSDFAKTNWEIRKFLWAPVLKCFGIQQITFLKGVMLLHGAGVGGGSLVYANTLMQPNDEVFKSDTWSKNINWLEELKPFYSLAKKMLGVTQNRIHSKAEDILLKLGEEMNCPETFHLTDVAVYFGEAGKRVSDPYFAGAGPDRTGCTACGACMVGCRVGAKNTLDKNYLHFAEKWGTIIFPELKVRKIIPNSEGYTIDATSVHDVFFGKTTTFKAKNVVVSSGVLGSVDLLLRNRDVYKTLPNISPLLGDYVKTNGESLCGVTSLDTSSDLSKGIAIGSALHPDSITKIEAVRYNSGSSVMRFLAVPMTGNGNRLIRPLKFVLTLIVRLPIVMRLALVKDWAKQTMILLVMQTVDVHIRLRLGRSFLCLFRKSLVGDTRLPSFLPVAQTATKKLANLINGVPQNAASEVLFATPATAHILGGCVIGDNDKNGVINSEHNVFSYPGLYVCDGSVVPANLGVNPSLTISAMAERFASKFPVKDENLFRERHLRITS